MSESNRPGKIHITHSLFFEDIWIDEYLSLPEVGIMFMTTDEETGEATMNTLFTSGVLIQEWEGIMSADEFHAMVLQQKKNVEHWAEIQTQKEQAMKALKESGMPTNDPSTA